MTDYEMNDPTADNCNGDFTQDQESEKMDSDVPEQAIVGAVEEDDEDDRKLFIGGLSWNTNSDGLKKYCEGYGEVLSCDLKTHPNSDVSRCFAFVVFKDVLSVKDFLGKTSHDLDGKVIDPKLATKQEDATKIFVGGVSTQATDDEIRAHFEQFGKISEMSLPVDAENKRRPFCFIVYESKSSVVKATNERLHNIHGKECEVKKSVPRGRGGQSRGFNTRGGRGGSGYSRGGSGGGGYQSYGGYAGYGGYGGGSYGAYSNYAPSYDYYGYSQGGYGGGWGGYDQSYGQQSGFGKARGRGGRGYNPY